MREAYRDAKKRAAALLLTLALSLQGVPAEAISGYTLKQEDGPIITEFIQNFSILAAVPRQSKHEKAISDRMKKWAEDLGFTVRQNEANDLIFDVPATSGYESLPLTALQAHMDMVCIAADGVEYDPLKDPIEFEVDQETGMMHSKGHRTSLGADDGVGVAMIMAIVKGKMKHGPLRIILTTDEELDMTGADAITKEDLAGVKYLINIDSEESDKVTVSSAGASGIKVEAKVKKQKLSSKKKKTALKVSVSELLGGHSGVEIDKGRCNGIRELAKVLYRLRYKVPYELSSIKGGRADNAIPSAADAVIVVKNSDVKKARKFIKDEKSRLKKEFSSVEKNLNLKSGKTKKPSKVLQKKQANNIIKYIVHSINGVHSWYEKDVLVESSNNIGQINVSTKGILIRQMSRSSSAKMQTEIDDKQKSLCKKYDLKVTVTPGASSWPMDPGSVLTQKITEAYKEVNGSEMEVVAIHAGLECGTFYVLDESIDMVSVGPDLTDVHSPQETLDLTSVPKTWRMLEKVLVSL